MFDKITLRKKAKELLKAMLPADRLEKSRKITLHVVELLFKLQKSNSLLGLYSPLNDEPLLILSNVKTAYPALANQEMVFKRSTSDELHLSSEFKRVIKVPAEDAEVVTPNVLIIPALAFDKSGKRLGRGGGFYDRYLANFQGVKIGVAFSEQIFESLPSEKHDEVVDFVVTDEQVWEILAS